MYLTLFFKNDGFLITSLCSIPWIPIKEVIFLPHENIVAAADFSCVGIPQLLTI